MRERLARLNADYELVTGRSFRHFFCPILYRDEDVELCRAHVINKAFRGSDKSWTIQRKDVDNYYGSLVERDFSALREKGRQADEALADRTLARQLNPKIVLDGEVVDHYVVQGDVPPEHSKVTFFGPDGSVQLALKLSPATLMTARARKWEIHIDEDFRVPAVASLLKAAHLTLFHLHGYRYALSAGGNFLGKTVLGEFFLKTRDMDRASALRSTHSHFREFAGLVRPMELSQDWKGTLTDRFLFRCMTGDQHWAFLVLIRTSDDMYGVIVPTMDDHDPAVRFAEFLKS